MRAYRGIILFDVSIYCAHCITSRLDWTLTASGDNSACIERTDGVPDGSNVPDTVC